MSQPARILAVTACPTGIAHTFMAAEKLQEAAAELGHDLRVETHGSIGVEGVFTDAELATADAVVVAADKQVDLARFAGIPTVTTGVDEGIRHPRELLERALTAAPLSGERTRQEPGTPTAVRANPMRTVYKALMNGVSHMIPFVVTGGLLIAISLTLGGTPTAEGLQVPEGTAWWTINQLGVLAFTVMVPVLSGYIAQAIADRPGLAPGMVTGFVAVTGSLYGSEAGAGFLGGIITGFASGYLALALKRIPVHRHIQPIMPIIVIPVVTTVVVGGLFVYLVGAPVAGFFELLTRWLGGMDGTSAIVLGVILGAMIGSDMGGPLNKTAFLFGGGLIAAGNPHPMGMAAAAIAVPPLGMGLASVLRRRWFTPQERESGIAALFMGFFGITEGAIPFAAARPLQVIPANVIGGAVAGGIAGTARVGDHVMHGGPIVAVLGAVDRVLMFFAAILIGSAVTAAVALLLMGLQRRRHPEVVGVAPAPAAAAGGATAASSDRAPGAGAQPADAEPAAPSSSQTRPGKQRIPLEEYLRPEAVLLDARLQAPEEVIRVLAERGADSGRIVDAQQVVDTALAREAEGSTGVGRGIAIPHAKSDGAAQPFVGFARLADGLRWDDTQVDPVRLVLLIAVPQAAAGNEHLKILAQLSRALAKDSVRDRLLEARDAQDVLDALQPAAR